jgi:hypothetical protein
MFQNCGKQNTIVFRMFQNCGKQNTSVFGMVLSSENYSINYI